MLVSVGGYTALSTAAFHEKEVVGVALLNSAGRFKDPEPEAEGAGEEEAPRLSPVAWVVKRAQALAKRVGIYIAFQQARQPSRIQQVLETVWPYSLDLLLAEASSGPGGWTHHSREPEVSCVA